MICIYCKQAIVSGKNSSVEHVFPHALGCPNDFTLDCVCLGCNTGFGRTIDQWLANDSPEGARRLQVLGRSPRSKKKEAKKRKKGAGQQRRQKTIRLRISLDDDPAYGIFRGAIVWISSDQPDKLEPAPQLVLTDDNGNRHHFTQDMLTAPRFLEQARALPKKGAWVLGAREEQAELSAWLVREGILSEWTPRKTEAVPASILSDGAVTVRIQCPFDRDLQRAIAKIALNYFAKIRGGEQALKPAFDDIRAFIADDRGDGFVSLSVATKTDLVDTPADDKFLHVFGLRHVRNSSELHFRLMLFSAFNYAVVLSKNYQGLIADSIHVYDGANRRLEEGRIGRILLPRESSAFHDVL